jgi:hypothetical protein
MATALHLDGDPTDDGHGALTFVGNATTVLRLGGFTVLTDPNFLHAGEHAYLGLGLRSRRLLGPALDIDELPPLDLVLLSHHHGDHFDRIAAAELDPDLPIVTEPHSAEKLRSQGFRRPIALETWEQQHVVRGDRGLRITAMPAKHAPQPLRSLLPHGGAGPDQLQGPDALSRVCRTSARPSMPLARRCRRTCTSSTAATRGASRSPWLADAADAVGRDPRHSALPCPAGARCVILLTSDRDTLFPPTGPTLLRTRRFPRRRVPRGSKPTHEVGFPRVWPAPSAVATGSAGKGLRMSDHDRIRKPARDDSATDPTQGEHIPMETDELARRRANDGEQGKPPQPSGEPGSPAERGAGSDLGIEKDPEATHVGDPADEER